MIGEPQAHRRGRRLSRSRASPASRRRLTGPRSARSSPVRSRAADHGAGDHLGRQRQIQHPGHQCRVGPARHQPRRGQHLGEPRLIEHAGVGRRRRRHRSGSGRPTADRCRLDAGQRGDDRPPSPPPQSPAGPDGRGRRDGRAGPPGRPRQPPEVDPAPRSPGRTARPGPSAAGRRDRPDRRAVGAAATRRAAARRARRCGTATSPNSDRPDALRRQARPGVPVGRDQRERLRPPVGVDQVEIGQRGERLGRLDARPGPAIRRGRAAPRGRDCDRRPTPPRNPTGPRRRPAPPSGSDRSIPGRRRRRSASGCQHRGQCGPRDQQFAGRPRLAVLVRQHQFAEQRSTGVSPPGPPGSAARGPTGPTARRQQIEHHRRQVVQLVRVGVGVLQVGADPLDRGRQSRVGQQRVGVGRPRPEPFQQRVRGPRIDDPQRRDHLPGPAGQVGIDPVAGDPRAPVPESETPSRATGAAAGSRAHPAPAAHRSAGSGCRPGRRRPAGVPRSMPRHRCATRTRRPGRYRPAPNWPATN